MTALIAPTRRGFLRGAASAAGALVVGFHLPAGAMLPTAALPGGEVVNSWLRIGPDGMVTVLSNVTEMGQGSASSLAQIVAEELDVEWKHVCIQMAPVEPAYNNPGPQLYGVWGSYGTAPQVEPLRKVSAQARLMLIEAAAARWGVPTADCTARSGVVHHAGSDRKAGYGELAADAAGRTPPADPPLKPKEEWRMIGKPMQRKDIPAKVDGSARFGTDISLPGLRTATIRQAPALGGKLVSVEQRPALALRGVEKVVRLPDAVAVVAKGYWPAKKGLDALSPVWDLSANPQLDSAAISARLHGALEQGEARTWAPRGPSAEEREAKTAAALKGAAKVVSHVYEVPFQHHATMEPMNATARVTADGAELWLPTQSQTQARELVADALGLPLDRVTIHTTLVGGGFGRRIEVDYAVQAALIARDAGVPVKLIWSREEDIAHGFYRPAAVGRMTAGLDAAGRVQAMVFEAAAPSLLDYSVIGRIVPPMPVEFTGLMYAMRLPYKFGAYRCAFAKTDVGVRCGFWRSVGDSQNNFFIESFLDELAVETGTDPIELRRPLLADAPRELGVIDAVATAAGWGRPRPQGVHQGFALSRSNDSCTAMVVEVGVEGSRVRLHKVWAAIDVGLAVNPSSIRQQLEGGILFGLTSAIHGQITIQGGAVEQSNFHDFPLMTLAEAPEIEVIIRETGDRIGGVGEEGVAAAPSALVNALYRATGTRFRRLPLADQGLEFG